MLNQGKVKQQLSEKSTSKVKKEKKISLTTTATSCKICSGNHAIYRSEELLKQSISDRMKSIREKKLCINYLNAGHVAKECRSSTCKKCAGRHNTIFYLEAENQSNKNDVSVALVVTCCSDKVVLFKSVLLRKR